MHSSREYSGPPNAVLGAFKLEGKVRFLSGGQGRTYLVDDTVLKYYPYTEEEELTWIAGLVDRLNPTNFRLQKFIKTDKENYLFNNWGAHKFLEGEMLEGTEHLAIKREVLQDFHRAIQNEPFPQYMIKRTDPWAVADKMVWGEKPIECHKRIMNEIEQLIDFIEPLNLPFQLIQGDPSNILFSNKEPPAVIDLSLYFRPANFPLAILAADNMCCWCKGECYCLVAQEIYIMFSDIPFFDQLLLRAVLRRALEYEGLSKSDKNYLNEIQGIVPAIEFVTTLFEENRRKKK